YLLERIQSDKRPSTDYLTVKLLLEDFLNRFSDDDLQTFAKLYIDFLLITLRNMIHDMGDNNVTSKAFQQGQQTDTPAINKLISVVSNISLKRSKCSWYPKLINLIKKKSNLFKLALDDIDLESRETQERELIEELWVYAL
ncbi:33561_t:CDS:2, partial [Gigaspora margarita]